MTNIKNLKHIFINFKGDKILKTYAKMLDLHNMLQDISIRTNAQFQEEEDYQTSR